MQSSNSPCRARAFVALVWMTCGLFVMLVPPAWPGRVFGFSMLFWLVGAPACILLALQPGLPLRLLMPVCTPYRYRGR